MCLPVPYVYTNLSDQLYQTYYYHSRVSLSVPLAELGHIKMINKGSSSHLHRQCRMCSLTLDLIHSLKMSIKALILLPLARSS